MPSPADLCTWPRNTLPRESKRRPVVVLSRLVGPLDRVRRSAQLGSLLPNSSLVCGDYSLALCDPITCLLVSLLGEPFGWLELGSLAQPRRRGALALGLMPSDLRPAGG